MNELAEKFEMIAKTFAGLEPALEEELQSIEADEIISGRRMVKFKGDKKCLYKANIHLRTALRILKPIDKGNVKSIDEYYDFFRNIEWEKYMNLHHSFAIDAVVTSKLFNNSLFAAQRAKDAIVDRFRDKYHKRPLVDTKSPKVLINVHMAGESITVSLDSSGDPLNKRGYRLADGGAPLNEVLAAAMIKYSGWEPTTPFVDPMTGSGTLAIEAAMIARNIPPGMLRKNFAFQNWKDYDKVLYNNIIDEIEISEIRPKIFANDISEEVIEIAKNNARKALVSSFIKFSNKDALDFQPKVEGSTLVINPPYGERLKPEELNELYADLGTALKNNYSGGKAWLISSNKEAFKRIGLRYNSRMELFNGGLLCWFAGFELFQGKLKDFKKEKNTKQ